MKNNDNEFVNSYGTGNWKFDCPTCNCSMWGRYEESVYCPNCKTTYETDFWYVDDDSGEMTADLTGKSHKDANISGHQRYGSNEFH